MVQTGGSSRKRSAPAPSVLCVIEGGSKARRALDSLAPWGFPRLSSGRGRRSEVGTQEAASGLAENFRVSSGFQSTVPVASNIRIIC